MLRVGSWQVQYNEFVRCWSQPIGIADVQGARQYALQRFEGGCRREVLRWADLIA